MARRAALLVGLALVAAGCGANPTTGTDPAATYLPGTTVYTGSFPTVPLTAPTGVAAPLVGDETLVSQPASVTVIA